MFRRAFTLLELLVVIAIIAILAAILFPVFAQAKVAAKKTADLSNMKNIATASMIYSSDADDLFPLQAGKDCSNQWNYNSRVYFPFDWNVASNVADASGCMKRVRSGLSTPANSMMPYIKNSDIWMMPGTSPYVIDTTGDWNNAPANVKGKQFPVSYSMNGLMSEMSTAAVTSPASTPAFWPNIGQKAGVLAGCTPTRS